jgi:hypothetical protein
MNINLHIERLVLDGIPLASGERPLLRVAVEEQLTRLLTNGGLKNAMQSGGALYNVKAPSIQLANLGDLDGVGEQIAKAVYGGVGK